MKKLIIVACFLFVLSPVMLMADGFGIGPTVGLPTGLEALWWFTPSLGLEAGAGITLDSAIVYHADLMFTLIRVTDKQKGVGRLVPRAH